MLVWSSLKTSVVSLNCPELCPERSHNLVLLRVPGPGHDLLLPGEHHALGAVHAIGPDVRLKEFVREKLLGRGFRGHIGKPPLPQPRRRPRALVRQVMNICIVAVLQAVP